MRKELGKERPDKTEGGEETFLLNFANSKVPWSILTASNLIIGGEGGFPRGTVLDEER